MAVRATRSIDKDGKVASLKPPCPSGSAIFPDQAWRKIARSLGLSGREFQIVRGVFDDHTEFAIAADLGIAHRTVHTHFERLHRKLAIADRAQLIIRVMQEFLALTASPKSNLPPICGHRTVHRCPLRAPG